MSSKDDDSKKVVIIGGGWAGFSAADALSTARVPGTSDPAIQVELLDASPRGPGGLAGGWRTPKLKRPVEAGLHGFWREYKNTFATIKRIGLDLDDVLTLYTPSILVSESGRVALAPILGGADEVTKKKDDISVNLRGLDFTDPSALLASFADLLPPPLDVALLAEYDENNPLTLADRISALGLLGAWADFGQEDPESWDRYDKISADNLFRSIAGVSPRLYKELVSPLLHVLPMTPGYDCSAAAALSCFHAFALQARGAFDVRWCRGTISEKIFNPWAKKLQDGGNVHIRGSAKVTSIEERRTEGGTKFTVSVNGKESIECDAVVLAVGGTAIKRLVPSCPPLAKLPEADGWKNFRGVTCVAIRLFLRPFVNDDGSLSLPPSVANAMKDSPVVVCGANVGGIPQLSETGFCIYDLQRLQDEFKYPVESNGDEACVALEVDFFRANDMAQIEDNMEVAKLALRAVSAALDIKPIDPELLVDISVVRAKDAVSHFCVNSASWSPEVKLGTGLYICGDWVDRKGHASWSTEKAVVTARQAAGVLATDFGFECDAEVIPAASDTPQLAALKQAAKFLRRVAPKDFVPPAPWILAKRISGRRI
jgi:uncharacterized protein with NAD-binding domain and iron-sulfur cluster